MTAKKHCPWCNSTKFCTCLVMPVADNEWSTPAPSTCGPYPYSCAIHDSYLPASSYCPNHEPKTAPSSNGINRLADKATRDIVLDAIDRVLGTESYPSADGIVGEFEKEFSKGYYDFSANEDILLGWLRSALARHGDAERAAGKMEGKREAFDAAIAALPQTPYGASFRSHEAERVQADFEAGFSSAVSIARRRIGIAKLRLQ